MTSRYTEYKKRRIQAYKDQIAELERQLWQANQRIEELQTALHEKEQALYWVDRRR